MDVIWFHPCFLHCDPGKELEHRAPNQPRGLLALVVVERIELDEIDTNDGLGRGKLAEHREQIFGM